MDLAGHLMHKFNMGVSTGQTQSPSFQAYIRCDTLTVAASFLTLALSSAITSFTDCRCFCLRLTGANHGRMAWHCLLSSLAAYRHRIIARLSSVCWPFPSSKFACHHKTATASIWIPHRSTLIFAPAISGCCRVLLSVVARPDYSWSLRDCEAGPLLTSSSAHLHVHGLCYRLGGTLFCRHYKVN